MDKTKKKLEILVGISGSGKSTYAKKKEMEGVEKLESREVFTNDLHVNKRRFYSYYAKNVDKDNIFWNAILNIVEEENE